MSTQPHSSICAQGTLTGKGPNMPARAGLGVLGRFPDGGGVNGGRHGRKVVGEGYSREYGVFECGALCKEGPRTRGRKAIWRDPRFIGRGGGVAWACLIPSCEFHDAPSLHPLALSSDHPRRSETSVPCPSSVFRVNLAHCDLASLHPTSSSGHSLRNRNWRPTAWPACVEAGGSRDDLRATKLRR